MGKTADEAADLIELTIECEKAGAFAVDLECVPDRVAKIITETLGIPVIGIGAGINCDGQALVTQDIVGLFEHFVPKFVKQYLNLWEEITGAVKDFKVEVETFMFPRPEHSFSISEEQFLALMSMYEQKRKADEPEGRS